MQRKKPQHYNVFVLFFNPLVLQSLPLHVKTGVLGMSPDRRGRPKLPAKEKRRNPVMVRFTDAEIKRLEMEAGPGASTLDVQRLVRDRALDARWLKDTRIELPPPPQPTIDLRAELQDMAAFMLEQLRRSRSTEFEDIDDALTRYVRDRAARK